MESKVLFEVSTAWPFPILQYTTNTSYVEVRKASGLAYIILQLISSSDDNSEKLVSTLKSLGVPNDIHYIFAGELAYMINYGIIQMKSGCEFGSERMDIYLVSDFEITELGKKLFKEGTIPTGNNQVKKLNVYYDVSKKDTQVKSDYKLFRIENSTLDEDCVGDTVLDNDDVEMFISENINKYAFKKGERISGFAHEKHEILVYKLEDAVSIKISQNGAVIQAKDRDRDEFINKLYSVSTIARIMDAKKKYHFPEFIMNNIKEYDFEALSGITKIYMPAQIGNITNIKSALSLNRNCDIRGAECSLDRANSAELMDKCRIDGIACYFENSKLFAIVPGRFGMRIEGYTEKCSLNLIILQQVSDDIQTQLMREIFLNCIETDTPLEKIEIIRNLTRISKCKDYLEQYTNYLLQDIESLTDKINLFIQINYKLRKEEYWWDYARTVAESLFEILCNNISVDSFVAQNILGKKLNEIIGMNDLMYISRLSKKLIEEEDDVIAFEACEGAGFSIDTVLCVVNVFKEYCKQIIDEVYVSGNSKLSSQFTLLGQALSELRDMTGIDNPYEDSAELDFDHDKFYQVMATFTDSIRKIEKYKAFALDEYKYLLFLQERFIEIKEVVTIEKEATKNPKNINKAYIDQLLKKSRYKDAICDLHVRLQYELNRLFEVKDIPTFELLSDNKLLNYLGEEEIDRLHALRICRNGFQHPKEKRDVQYSEQIIKEWCSIVEKLGG
ncbi:hypothetical protein [Peptostreptococcus stomatis]